MGMPLSEWDRKVAPLLRDIEFRATMLKHHSHRLKENVAALVAMPSFATRAEAELVDAASAAQDVVSALREAKLAITEKPLDD